MMKRTKIEVWISYNQGKGEETIKAEDISKLVEEMKGKILSLNDRIVIVGMTTSEEV